MPQGMVNYYQTVHVAKVVTDMAPYSTIQGAINAITDEAAGKRYAVIVHDGVYTEAITMARYIDVIGVSKDRVIIDQNDASIVTLNDDVTIENVTLRLNTPSVARNMIVEGGAPTARTNVVFRDCIFAITTPGGFASRVAIFQAASSVSFIGCETSITDGANPGIQIIRNDTVAATIVLAGNTFELNDTAGFVVFSNIAGTWTLRGNLLSGTAGGYSVALGTIRGYGNIITTTAAHAVAAAASVVEKSGRQQYEVYAGMVIADAIAAAAADTPAPAVGAPYIVKVHPGVYAESNLPLVGAVHLVGENADSCRIVAADAANPIVACAVTTTIADLTIGNTNAGAPAVGVTGGALTMWRCVLYGTGVGDAITMTAGLFDIYDTTVGVGDIDLSTANCILQMFRCRLTTDPINTAGAFAHNLYLENCDLGNQSIVSAATLATTLSMWGCVYVGTVSNAGTGAFTIHESDIDTITVTNAGGSAVVKGGSLDTCGGAVGSVTWKSAAQEYTVMAGMSIQQAITAAAADIPAPSAVATYVVFVRNGSYLGAITSAQFINIVGESRDWTEVFVNDANLLILASNTEIANLVMYVNAPTAARNVITDNAVAVSGVSLNDVTITVVSPGATASSVVHLSAASNIEMNRCILSISGAGATTLVLNDTAGATLSLNKCDFRVVSPTSRAFASSVAGAWTVRGGEITGTGIPFVVTLGTITMHGTAVTAAATSVVTGGSVTIKCGKQQYEVWAGMVIQQAITAAAADTPAPAATSPYTVLIHPGIHVGAVVCSTFVHLKGAAKDAVIIQQVNADVVTLASNVEIENLTVRITTPDAQRSLLKDNAVALTGVKLSNIVLAYTTPAAIANLGVLLTGGSVVTMEHCSANWSVPGTGAEIVLSVTTAASTVLVDGCNFRNTNVTAGSLISSAFAGTTITVVNSRLAGTVRHLVASAGVIRVANTLWHSQTRTATGVIIDESPYPALSALRVVRRQWELAALANQNIATRVAIGGAVAAGGSGQARLRINDNAADAAGTEQAADAAGALASTWTPARGIRYVMPISAGAFRATTSMFFGVRGALGAAVPGAAEHHAGFIWTGAAFNASSSNGGGVGATTALTTPSTGVHHILEVIVVGAVQVEFYVDGVLVATHAAAAGIPTAALYFQEYEISTGLGGATNSDITLREGWLQECPN